MNRTPIASRQHARRLASLALATGLTLGLGGTLAACSDQDIDDTADQVKDVSGEARGVVDQARQSIDDAHATFAALPQRMPRGFTGSKREWNHLRRSLPELADPKVSPGLIGLPDSMIDDLLANVIKGSGRIIKGGA